MSNTSGAVIDDQFVAKEMLLAFYHRGCPKSEDRLRIAAEYRNNKSWATMPRIYRLQGHSDSIAVSNFRTFSA